MRPRLRFIATTALCVALAAGAQAVDLSRYKYTIHTDAFGLSQRRQLDLQLMRTLCRDDDGCLVILNLDEGIFLQVKTTHFLLKGAHRWMSEQQGSTMVQDNDHAEDIVLFTGTIFSCTLSDQEETGSDDSDDGFSVFLTAGSDPNTCVVTFID
jgi:hypothetical protein